MGSILDVFNGEAFKLRSMCEAINKIPPMFNYLGSEGIFKEQGSSSTTVAIEENQGKLSEDMSLLIDQLKKETEE